MGAELVGLVFAGYSSLPGNQFKVLTRMALAALDKPHKERPAAVYFGGWEPLSMALGREIPYLSGDPATLTKRRKELQQEVTKICRQLRAAGAIEPVEKRPHQGTRQAFILTLTMDDFTTHREDDLTTQQGGQNHPPEGGQNDHP